MFPDPSSSISDISFSMSIVISKSVFIIFTSLFASMQPSPFFSPPKDTKASKVSCSIFSLRLFSFCFYISLLNYSKFIFPIFLSSTATIILQTSSSVALYPIISSTFFNYTASINPLLSLLNALNAFSNFFSSSIVKYIQLFLFYNYT